MTRAFLVTACGLLSGLLIGILGPITLVAALAWRVRASWSILTDENLPYWVAVGFIGAVNGGIGAWNGRRSDARRPWPVCWVPLMLLLYPLAVFVQYPHNSKIWGVILLVVAWVGLFVLVAGLVGHKIGVAGSGLASATEDRPPN